MPRGGSNRVVPRDWETPEIITEFLDRVRQRGGIESTTIKTYRSVLVRMAYWLWTTYSIRPEEATAGELQAWRGQLSHARSTQHIYISTVQTFYKWAARAGYVEKDPAWDLPKPRRRKTIPRPLDEASLEIAIATAPHRIRPWLILAGWAGLRACEIAALERDDVRHDEEHPYLLVQGKGEKQRRVPMSPYVWEALLVHGLPSRGAIFRRLDGRPITAAIVSEQCNRFLHDLGINGTLHKIRHRFGRAYLRTGGKIRDLKEVLGHESLNQTAGYGPEDEEAMHAVVRALTPGPN